MRALQKDPSARFQTVGEFSHALDASAGADATTAAMPRPSRAPQGAPTMSRTALNPALGDGQGQPQGAAARPGRARTSLPRPPRCGPRLLRLPGARLPRLNRGAAAIAVALCAVVAGAAVLMPRTVQRVAPPAVPPQPVAACAAARGGLAARPPLRPAADTAASAGNHGAAHLGHRSLGSDGHFKPGERIRLQVTPSHDAHVYCYLQDETQRIVRFYPNRFRKSALVTAAAPLEIPGPMRLRDPGEHAQRDGDDCLLRERARSSGPAAVRGARHRLRETAAHLARPGAKRLCARWRRQAGRSQLPGSVQLAALVPLSVGLSRPNPGG